MGDRENSVECGMVFVFLHNRMFYGALEKGVCGTSFFHADLCVKSKKVLCS